MSFFLFLRALSLESIVAELTSTSDKEPIEPKKTINGIQCSIYSGRQRVFTNTSANSPENTHLRLNK